MMSAAEFALVLELAYSMSAAASILSGWYNPDRLSDALSLSSFPLVTALLALIANIQGAVAMFVIVASAMTMYIVMQRLRTLAVLGQPPP